MPLSKLCEGTVHPPFSVQHSLYILLHSVLTAQLILLYVNNYFNLADSTLFITGIIIDYIGQIIFLFILQVYHSN